MTFVSNQWSTLRATLVSAEAFCESQERHKAYQRNVSESPMSSRLEYWLPAISVAILISLFSTRFFSGEQSARVIFPILRWLFPSAHHHMLQLMHFEIREAAHIIGFALFSIAVFYGVRADRYGWKLQWAAMTLVIAVCYAGLDEWHQSFVPLRDARGRDVVIDASGALLA